MLKVKRILLTILCLLSSCLAVYADTEIDSLLKELDQTIVDRKLYTSVKEQKIDDIKKMLTKQSSLEDRFHLHTKIIEEYQSFICDSALAYIDRNIAIANVLQNEIYLVESKLKLAFVLSLSGLFTQAREVFDMIDYHQLPQHLKALYCWDYIRYNENLLKYTDNPTYGQIYIKENRRYRDSLMQMLGKDTDMYLKEKSFQLKGDGAYAESAQILTVLFEQEKPGSHSYGMSAMALSMIHRELKNTELEVKYLLLAAITDVKLAVKENESLLTLAIHLHKNGDVNRAYNYIQASLEDANFYNSRFRNAVISRTQPIIEATYLAKIEEQKKNLRMYALTLSIFVVILIFTLYFLYKQVKIVSRARKNLKQINTQLISVNQKLDEANLIRERYIGYYINQCAVYLDKLDDYRKQVNRKIKAGQIDDLQKLTSSTRTLEKDAQELYEHFDSTFFEVYPNFVDEFNALLREEERYQLKKDQLNTELRIFALIRLGITDVNQIAIFLRYSIQTIYNYKSKVKGKVLADSDNFDEKVKKIGGFEAK